MNHFDQKINSLSQKLIEITPKHKTKANELSEFLQNLTGKKQESSKMSIEWQTKINNLNDQIHQWSLKLYEIQVEREHIKGYKTENQDQLLEQCQKESEKFTREAEKRINELYCHHIQQLTSQTQETRLQLKLLREEIERQLKALKKILNESNLNINYDKQYYKKLQQIKQNEEAKKQKLNSMENKIKKRINEIESKFTEKIKRNRMKIANKDEKGRRILQILSQLL